MLHAWEVESFWIWFMLCRIYNYCSIPFEGQVYFSSQLFPLWHCWLDSWHWHSPSGWHYRYKILLTFKTSRANLKVNMCCEYQLKFEKEKYSFIQMSRIKLCMSIKLETRRKWFNLNWLHARNCERISFFLELRKIFYARNAPRFRMRLSTEKMSRLFPPLQKMQFFVLISNI